jgi:hypothetical protein
MHHFFACTAAKRGCPSVIIKLKEGRSNIFKFKYLTKYQEKQDP